MNTLLSAPLALLMALVLLLSPAQAQQANPQPSATSDEVLKSLSPEEREAMLKRLLAEKLQQPPAPTAPPSAQAPPIPKTEPIPAAPCEAPGVADKTARVVGRTRWWRTAATAVANKTGVYIGSPSEITDAMKRPCTPATGAKGQASK